MTDEPPPRPPSRQPPTLIWAALAILAVLAFVLLAGVLKQV